MNKNKGSVHILAIAIIAAMALMAFAVSTAGPVAAEQSDVGYRTTKE
jgi:hypothetical protein